jgi:hypothetical protein
MLLVLFVNEVLKSEMVTLECAALPESSSETALAALGVVAFGKYPEFSPGNGINR